MNHTDPDILEPMRWYSIHYVVSAVCQKFSVEANLIINPRLGDIPGVLEFHPRSSLQTCRILDLDKFWEEVAEDVVIRDATHRLGVDSK